MNAGFGYLRWPMNRSEGNVSQFREGNGNEIPLLWRMTICLNVLIAWDTQLAAKKNKMESYVISHMFLPYGDESKPILMLSKDTISLFISLKK